MFIMNKNWHTIKDLSEERLKELLHYCPETGVFTWIRSNCNRVGKGGIAGLVHHSGYLNIGIDKKEYRASRLAFLYMEGYFPEHYVDHINRNKLDNRWENLRHASAACNTINSKKNKRNTSGVVGVGWNKQYEAWEARIGINKKDIHIGIHKSFNDAVRARWKAEKKYNFPNCNITSSAFLYLKERNLAGGNPETPC